VQGLSADRLEEFAFDVARTVDETLLYYRGRNRREVKRIHLCGGGALHPEVSRALSARLSIEVVAFDPLGDLASEPLRGEWADLGPRLATACGLCHWWDEPRV
jgi:Tfp pilus assembly PilM family ATPase